MLRTIIVDDEKLSIEYLEHLLKDVNGVEIVGKYTDGHVVLEEFERKSPELVFLDISMPGVSGIEIAKKIKSILPECKIVFVTAYKQYALKAFEIGVTDYIVKPFKKARIQQLMDRIIDQNNQEIKTDEYVVCNFKYFHFKKNGKEIKNVKWRTAKARELFVYLVQNDKEFVRKDVLIELLWSDLKVDNAYDNLYSTIYHIRKTLEAISVNIDIISTVHGYELQCNDVKYDVEVWGSGLGQLENLSKETYFDCKEIMKLYTGDYLAEETYVWKENEQERLRVLYIAKSKDIIDYLIEQENYTEAILQALHLQRMYPYMDYSYFMLMQLYDEFGDLYNVERQYNKLKRILEED